MKRVGRWVDVDPTRLVRDEGEGPKSYALSLGEAAKSNGSFDMGLVSGQRSPCLVRQLSVQKTISTLGRVANVTGSMREEIAQGGYLGSGPRIEVTPYILLLFSIHGGVPHARGLQGRCVYDYRELNL